MRGQCLTDAQMICVDGRLANGVCVEYCDKKCWGCTGSPTNCFQCSDNSSAVANGCSSAFSLKSSIIGKLYFVVTHLRVWHLKLFFLIVDDNELYIYHRPDYRGLFHSLIHAQYKIQQEINSVLDAIPFLDKVEGALPSHEQSANPKYLSMEREANGFLRNSVSYFLVEVPLVLCMYLSLNFFFHRLFNFEISRVLRIFSFRMCLWVMALESNLQSFSFLCFSNFAFLRSYDIFYKLDASLTVLFGFVLVFYALCFYELCHYLYGRLGKYFLTNFLRKNRSYFLMTLLYGVRPVVRGFLHSLYHSNDAQLLGFVGLDLLMVVVYSAFHVYRRLSINKGIFFCQCCYFFAGCVQNIALLCKNNESLTDEA